ncbi:S8 family serine peptidase [Streptomyces calidiresistens]|uniref:S8 family serine peptidase n=1 Tax=Streptomyces calidiresistens TaxID=1485586 RepID=A0A7W3T233_9ACTN|nr:S8 family serine peptidase [Streptomyces calidiresistens]MBB0229441.1 S8 family serine peptidase [Streptomyces calidiresistens]
MGPARSAAALLAGALTGTMLGGPAFAAPPDGPAGDTASAGTSRIVTLITGDRVVVGPDGRATGLIPAEGRKHIPIRMLPGENGTLVLPLDVVGAVADGTLDRRLFDTAELTRPEYDAIDGLPVIVLYEEGRDGGEEARETLHAEVDAEARTELDTIDAEALTLAEETVPPVWEALTVEAGDEETVGAELAPGVRAVTLDGVRQTLLDQSTGQIGVPAVRELGLDGEGVTIAVLDTGVDATHPDLADRVVKQVNFTDAPDVGDLFGHGTHVASIAAGTGAKSEGRFTGVAPGADVLDVKVLDDDGFGFDSEIIEGMEWAVEQGADIINMSLGGYAGMTIDPMEEAVNRLSAGSDSLFVIAAGNDGTGRGRLGSPGTADAALTVGAVDRDDAVADFSSSGPRLRDGALKPDVTAPGVGIAAAAAQGSLLERWEEPVEEGYLAISGTSMASPHVAGAAALLAQARPELTAEQIKAVLMGSAVGLADTPAHRQGSGRIDIERALATDVIVESGSVSFGAATWPHEEADPITREMVYRNLGTEDITLELTTEEIGPENGPAPEGMFSLSEETITVPAGGTAAVEVTADPRVEAGGIGVYSLFVTATGDGQEVRTAGMLYREPRMYELRVDHRSSDGEPTDLWDTIAVDPFTYEMELLLPDPDSGDGNIGVARVPEGEWLVDTLMLPEFDENGEPVDDGRTPELSWLLHPAWKVNEETEGSVLTHSAADFSAVDLTVHDRRALGDLLTATLELVIQRDEDGDTWEDVHSWGAILPLDGFSVRLGQTGEVGDGVEATGKVGAHWTLPSLETEYQAFLSEEGRLPTDLTRHFGRRDFARITTRVGSPAPGREGALSTLPEGFGFGVGWFRELPTTVEVNVAGDAERWMQEVWEWDEEDNWSSYTTPYRARPAGSKHSETLQVGVFGPNPGAGSFVRDGDLILGELVPLADGRGNHGFTSFDSARTTLYRDGEVLIDEEEPVDYTVLEVPAEAADYRLETSLSRAETPYGMVSSRVETAHTFRSAAPPEGEETQLPISAVRYQPKLALDSTAKAGKKIKVPLTVVGAAAGKNTETLRIEVSLDGGNTWKTTKVTGKAGDKKDNRSFTVHNPPAGGSVSLRAHLTDREGNTTEQTIIDAWRTR